MSGLDFNSDVWQCYRSQQKAQAYQMWYELWRLWKIKSILGETTTQGIKIYVSFLDKFQDDNKVLISAKSIPQSNNQRYKSNLEK